MKHVTPFHLFENASGEVIYYHGTSSSLPFERFDRHMDGNGIVNPSRKKFGGFFFTSERENALYYCEELLCRVRIRNITNAAEEEKHSPTVLKQAIADGVTLCLRDVVDGSHASDVVVVPYDNIDDVEIIGWEFVGEEESYFETLDKLFGMGEEDYPIDQEAIEDFFEMTGGGFDIAMTIPVFQKYYDSKR